MQSETRQYTTPVLQAKGEAITLTRIKVSGDNEPVTLQPRAGAGEVGLGL